MYNACKIVMYHYVRPIQKSNFPDIKGLELDGFQRQLNYFSKNFRFATAENLISSIYNNLEISEKSVVLTFDDGLKDHYQYSFPILKKMGIQGLFFPPTKILEEEIVLDVHKIHFILASSNKLQLVKEIFNLIDKYKKEWDLKEPYEYFKELAIANRFDSKEIIFIKRILQRKLPAKLRKKITGELFEKFVSKDENAFSRNLYLSKDEISEMKENGMYFGSHAFSHEWLTHLESEELEKELELSYNSYLKINPNKDTWIMCYPYGNYNDIIIEKIKEKKFKVGLTTEIGDAILNKENAFTLKRFDTNDFPQ